MLEAVSLDTKPLRLMPAAASRLSAGGIAPQVRIDCEDPGRSRSPG